MLKIDIKFDYATVIDRLHDYEGKILIRTVETVLLTRFAYSLRNRIIQNLQEIKETGDAIKAVQDMDWRILQSKFTGFLFQFLMQLTFPSDYIKMLEEGTVGKGGTLPDIKAKNRRYLAIPKPEALSAPGRISPEAQKYLNARPGSTEYKESFFRRYFGSKGEYSILFRRIPGQDPEGLFILKEMVSVAPRHIISKAVKMAEDELTNLIVAELDKVKV